MQRGATFAWREALLSWIPVRSASHGNDDDFVGSGSAAAGCVHWEVRPQEQAMKADNILATIGQTPEVDSARVSEIKQAISEGRFSVDSEKVADGLIESVRQMLAAQPRSA